MERTLELMKIFDSRIEGESLEFNHFWYGTLMRL